MNARHFLKALLLALGWAATAFILTPGVMLAIACGEDETCMEGAELFTLRMLVICVAVAVAVFGFVAAALLAVSPHAE